MLEIIYTSISLWLGKIHFVYQIKYTGPVGPRTSSWGTWNQVGKMRVFSELAVVATDDRLDAFALSQERKMLHCTSAPSVTEDHRTWSIWTTLGDEEWAGKPTAASTSNSNIQVFGINLDSYSFSKYWNGIEWIISFYHIEPLTVFKITNNSGVCSEM